MSRQEHQAAERAAADARRPDRGVTTASGHTSASSASVVAGSARSDEERARTVLAQSPDDAQGRLLLAKALRGQGRLDQAMLEARRAVAHQPHDPAAQEELGHVLLAQERVVEAVAAFERSVALAPERPHGHLALGAALLRSGVLDRAADHFERVTRLAPKDPAGHSNLGIAAQAMGDLHGASRALRRAVVLAPARSDVRFNRSLALLGTGNLARAWADYDYGFEAGTRGPRRQPPVPRWDGTTLVDKTVLVWREQGLGDEVRFASCYRDLIDRAHHVVIECTDRLTPLFRRSFPRATVRTQTFDVRSSAETADFRGIDLHTPAGSLPRFLRPSLEDFTHHRGYLVTDPRVRNRWRDRLAALGPELRVGIAWRSMNLSTSRLQHYLTLEEFDPVLQLSGVSLINLQYGPREHLESELRELEQRSGVVVHRWDDIDYTADIDAVAALTAELDVVVGPGSFPTVLAGALGVPTLVLTAPTPWTLGQKDDPWFPSVRTFVRAWDASWDQAARDAADHLAAIVADRASSGQDQDGS